MHQQKTETGQRPASTAYRISSGLLLALAVAIIFCSAGLLCFVVYDDRMMIGHVFNSDILFPISFVWNLRHDPGTWTTFQLPRIPSIFPDLVAYGTLDAVLGDFRAAIFGYSVFQCIAFACAAGWVIGQVAHARFVHAAALFLVLIEAVILVDLRATPIYHHFEIFTQFEHFGAFLMSLVTVALVGLKAGIAEYWLSRPATITTNWTLQIDPVVGDGTPFVWGNNWQSYRRSIQNPGQAPEYNFIVIDKLNPAALVQKFGQPERTAPCGSYTLWLYAEPIGPILLNQRR